MIGVWNNTEVARLDLSILALSPMLLLDLLPLLGLLGLLPLLVLLQLPLRPHLQRHLLLPRLGLPFRSMDKYVN